MATYRQIYITFWTDPKIDDDFTPEDKYFYLYLLTNNHTSVTGCYEISMKQFSRELGYNEDTIKTLLRRMEEVHKVIKYSPNTKEVLILNWHKYNWSSSPNFIKGISECLPYIKNDDFRKYVIGHFEELKRKKQQSKTVEDCIPTSVSVSVPVNDSDSFTIIEDSDRGVGEEEGTKKQDAKTEKPKKQDLFNEFAGEDQELLEVLRDFEKMRNQMKKPMSDRAKKMLVNKLEREFQKEQWVEVLEQSIFHGWDSVWPLRSGGNENGTGSNQQGRYGKAGGTSQAVGQDFSDLKPSLDPDDKSTWGS